MAYLPELALPGMTLTQFVTSLLLTMGIALERVLKLFCPQFFFLTVIWNGPLVDHTMRG